MPDFLRLYPVYEFADEAQRRAERRDVVPQTAQLDEIGRFLESSARQDILLQNGKIGLQIFGEIAAQHHVAVEHHMNRADPDGQMPQHVV